MFIPIFLIFTVNDVRINLDVESGQQAKYCGNPNSTFNQLIFSRQRSDGEISVHRRFKIPNGGRDVSRICVGASFWILQLSSVGKFKLSPESSSLAVETHAILRALDFIGQNKILYSNICSDSFSCLSAISSSAIGKYKLCPLVGDIRRMIYYLNNSLLGFSVRFSWCLVHCGVINNERANVEAKTATVSGLEIQNKVDFKQLISFFSDGYRELDDLFINSLNTGASNYYMQDLSDINIHLFRNFKFNRDDSCKLIRIISGYSFTNHFLHRIGLLDSPSVIIAFLIRIQITFSGLVPSFVASDLSSCTHCPVLNSSLLPPLNLLSLTLIFTSLND